MESSKIALVDVAGLAFDEELKADLLRNWNNRQVGQQLLSENERCRVWFLRLAPGERFGFHRHDADYFWTAMSEGTSHSRYSNGEEKEHTYHFGETQHFKFENDGFFIHDLTNTGSSDLQFLTVEFLNNAGQA